MLVIFIQGILALTDDYIASLHLWQLPATEEYDLNQSCNK